MISIIFMLRYYQKGYCFSTFFLLQMPLFALSIITITKNIYLLHLQSKNRLDQSFLILVCVSLSALGNLLAGPFFFDCRSSISFFLSALKLFPKDKEVTLFIIVSNSKDDRGVLPSRVI